MLTVVTALAFANAWPNAVVLDDKFFVNNPHLPNWTEPEEMFRGDVWRTTTAHSDLFRPALFVSLSIDSRLFGGWLAGYHLSNIVLHLAVTLCLYGFLLHLLRALPCPPERADFHALLAALVFAVHPVHTEAVNSVFNRSDMLVTLGALAGLWWLLHHLRRRPALAWAGLGVCYLLAMLSKETGVVIPGIAVALILLLSDDHWNRRIRRGLPVLWLLLPLALYFYLRARALAVEIPQLAGTALPGGGKAGGLEWAGLRGLLEVFGYWGEGLRLMVWPHPLKLYYGAPTPLAWTVLVAVQAGLLVTGLLQLRRGGRSTLLTALAWYYLALLPASRLIGPHGSEPGLAERYLYFASAGPTLGLAFLLAWFGRRYERRRVLLPVLLAVLALMPVTWVRNNDWRTDVRLFEKEYRRSGDHEETLRLVTAAHQKRGNHARGAEICDRHTERFGPLAQFTLNCGSLYHTLGRSEDAERAFLAILEAEGENAGASGNLALLYLQSGRVEEAVEAFKRAIETERDPAVKILRRGLMVAYLYPRDRDRLAQARAFFDAAYEIQPMMTMARAYSEMMDAAIEKLAKEESAPEDTATD
jgi:tetratricopeptide (TPR) repeat protein